MLIISLGIDIVEVARVKKDAARFGKRFVERILGGEELTIYDRRRDKAIFLAGRFAAKEAVIKSLGPMVKKRPALCAIQIVNDASGQPTLVLPREVKKKLGHARCLISITHERRYAAAVAIIEEDK